MTAGSAWSIRAAVPDDARAVSAVAGASWRATYRDLIDADRIERFVAGSYSEASVRRRISIADRFDVAVAGADTRGPQLIVGFAEWTVRDDEAELVATYLLPEWQRLGIGRALHTAALESYRGRVGSLTVQLLRDNHEARAFYESLGYRDPVEGRWELWGLSLPDLRLTLPLDEPDRAPG